jgi:predicted alpha/beta-fold hydrolase
MNHRNCGEGFAHARQSNHAGRSDDIARVIFELKRVFTRKQVAVLGFSLSGNASLLLASGVVPGQNIFHRDAFLERATQSHWALPDLVISVNPPVEFMRTTERFLQNFNRLYQWNFVRVFHKLVKDLKKMELLEQSYKTHPFMSIRQFDDIYTAQRGGFGTAANYYNLCGASPYLKQVFIPSYILTTKDDPIVDFKDIEKADKSQFIETRLENQGGHMGYLCKGKTPLGDFRWMDYAIDGIFKKMIA